MATAHKKLSSGQLTGSVANIYAPASTATGLVKTILLHNTNTTDEYAEVHFDGTADSDRILKVKLTADETFEWSVGHMVVVDGTASTAETLKGKSTNGQKVNYFIFGAEE